MTNLHRVHLFCLIVLAFAGFHCQPQSSQDDEPFNVVFILIDDMGWTDTAAFGSTFYETPHLDQLTQESMRFTSGYAACPVCSPTRASILTGKTPALLKQTDWIPGRGNRSDRMLIQQHSVKWKSKHSSPWQMDFVVCYILNKDKLHETKCLFL